MFNLQRGVDVLARIEIARLDNRWRQDHWGYLNVEDFSPQRGSGGEVLIDEVTGLPLGIATCNTAFCAAGWALTMGGIKMRWEEHVNGGWIAEETSDGGSISATACDWLGIERPEVVDDDERWSLFEDMPRLFKPYNTIDQMYEYTHEWVEESITVDDLRQMVGNRVLEMLAETPVRA